VNGSQNIVGKPDRKMTFGRARHGLGESATIGVKSIGIRVWA
jgi:hypothetical protein